MSETIISFSSTEGVKIRNSHINGFLICSKCNGKIYPKENFDNDCLTGKLMLLCESCKTEFYIMLLEHEGVDY